MTQSFAKAVTAYRQAATHVTPAVAVVRLYDEAIRRIRRASKAATDNRLEEAHAGVLRATTIFLGLMGSLDFAQSPELATTLKQTYVSNIMALHGGFGRPDMAARYDTLLGGLAELRNAWAQIAGLPEVPVRGA
ncbi:MAG: flagellar protein FliS [Alphaproteobacteria bacterium]|nr:flagellar protein FliS [Alphaproteobacteria bacterium]